MDADSGARPQCRQAQSPWRATHRRRQQQIECCGLACASVIRMPYAACRMPHARVSDPFKEATGHGARSEEHTSELQSLMRISYAVFCLKKKNSTTIQNAHTNHRLALQPHDTHK